MTCGRCTTQFPSSSPNSPRPSNQTSRSDAGRPQPNALPPACQPEAHGKSDPRSRGEGGEVTTCSFCGKTSRDVGPMVEGPNDTTSAIQLHRPVPEHLPAGEAPRLRAPPLAPRDPAAARDQGIPRPVRDRPGPRQASPLGRGPQPLQAPLAPESAESRASNSTSRNILCSGPPARARRSSPRRWPACSRCPSPSATRPRSPRRATSARTSRTSS
jgi:hypothetical protein